MCATQSGKLYSWGYNEQYQLGWGEKEAWHQGQQKPREVRIKGLTAVNKVVALDCGGMHTACALEDGGLFAWGSNSEGQIGQVLRKCMAEPQDVRSMEQDKCVAISCGRYSMCCVAQNKCAFFWGSRAPARENGTAAFEGAVSFLCSFFLERARPLAPASTAASKATRGRIRVAAFRRRRDSSQGTYPRRGPRRRRDSSPRTYPRRGPRRRRDSSQGTYQRRSRRDPSPRNCPRDVGFPPRRSLTGSSAPSTVGGLEKIEEEGEAPEFGGEAREKGGGGNRGASSALAGAAKKLMGTDIEAAAVGEAHGVLLSGDGSLRGWGYNAYGQAIGRVDRKSDLIDDPRALDLGDARDPTARVLKICASGGSTSLLVSYEG